MIDGWKKKSVGDIADVVTGKTPPTSDRTNYGDHLPFVSPADLGTYKYISKSEKHLSEKGAKKARILPVGTSLFTCIGSTIGKVGLTAVDLTTNQQINAAIPKNGSVNKEYLYYALCDIAPRVKRIAGVQAVPIINKTEFENQIIYLPADIPEQKAIAALLSTWDEAIEKTERLIQVKEKQLDAYARDLFDRKNDGKYEGWKVVKLKTVLNEHGNKSTGTEEVYSVSVHKGLVNQVEHLGRSFAAANTDNYNRVHYGDIVYTKSPTGDFPLGIVKQSYAKEDVIVSPLYGVFTPRTFYLGIVLNFYFSSPARARNYLFPIVQKGAKNTIAITNKTFLSKALHLPVEEKAQKAVAEFVYAAWEEIDLLKHLADKYKTQKRGLMQKMLTGEWRVKPEIVNQYREA